MQTQWIIKAPDGADIHGVTDFAEGGKKSEKLFVMCHGLTGHVNEQHFHAAPDFFNPRGYDTLRFNFYTGVKGARVLDQCTIRTHVDDLYAVLDAFAGDYRNVFISGHSFGGLTLALANPEQATAVSLWDPSFDTSDIFTESRCPVRKAEGGYLLQWAVQSLIGDAMFDEVAGYDREACADMAKNYKSPMQVVLAGDDVYAKRGENYHSFAPDPSELAVIDGATHCFEERGTRDALYEATFNWFERFAV